MIIACLILFEASSTEHEKDHWMIMAAGAAVKSTLVRFAKNDDDDDDYNLSESEQCGRNRIIFWFH